jgi:hypothetical protein
MVVYTLKVNAMLTEVRSKGLLDTRTRVQFHTGFRLSA